LDKKKEDDAEEDEEDEMPEEEIIEEEYDLGLFIKEELIPYAIEYYLGIVKEEGDEFDEDFEEDEEDVLS
jgi:nucleosome assembly protein 1-like 1